MLEDVVTLSRKVWYDFFNPAPEDLEKVAVRFGIHEAAIQDCLEPDHLPKVEVLNDITVFILRGIDEKMAPDAKTVRHMTRKLVVFVGADFILTVHRARHEYLERIKQRWREPRKDKPDAKRLIADLFKGVLGTYDAFQVTLLDRFSALEDRIFAGATSAGVFAEGYVIKRQAFVARQMLGMTANIADSDELKRALDAYQAQDLRDTTGKIGLGVQDIAEGVAAIINLQISLESQKVNEASHRINEIMRVLTMFSAVFLPLSFIAGIYGMNFQDMPELRTPWAYPATLAVMGVVALAILLWFYKRGWMKRIGPKRA